MARNDSRTLNYIKSCRNCTFPYTTFSIGYLYLTSALRCQFDYKREKNHNAARRKDETGSVKAEIRKWKVESGWSKVEECRGTFMLTR